jgi:hypothetical protein
VACHNDRQAAWEMIQQGRSASPLAPSPAGTPGVFSLLGETIMDPAAKRKWSDAYLVLTQARPERDNPTQARYAGNIDGRWVKWIGSQSVPTLLPPYFAGASKSPLIALLARGHHQVKLSREEMDKITCWIDLLVPFCGDYIEANAWSSEETAKYQRFLDKRRRMEEQERQNIRTLLAN